MRHPSTYIRTHWIAALALLAATQGAAQPVCSIDLGPDRVVCAGSSIQLDAPAGFASYLWSTGANTQSITVNSGGDYTCWVVTGQDLAINGDFSSGNTGFSTPFSNNTNLDGPGGRYFIGTNAANHHPTFIGTSTGNFLMVNATATNNNWNLWCQTVSVCPGQNYNLSFAVSNLSNGTATGQVGWFIDGAPVGGWHTPPMWSNNWQTFTTSFIAPASGSADICLRITGANNGGSDLGIDDIRLVGTTAISDQVHVDLVPRPSPAIPPTLTRCAGTSTSLDATVPGGTAYLWSDGTAGPLITIDAPGHYEVLITANGCQTLHAVDVVHTPLPPVDLGNDVVQCEGTTVTFSAFLAGATYLWSNGATTPTITTGVPGTYSVQVTRGGCTGTDEVVLSTAAMPAVTLGGDITICDGASVIIGVTAQPGTTYLWDDLSTSSTRVVSAPGTYTLEATLGFCSDIDQINVAVVPLPSVDLGADTTICAGNTIELVGAPAGATYLWSTGEITRTITVGAADTYSVTVTANGCSSTDAIVIDVAPPPSVDLGPDMDICAGNTITLDATTTGAGYLWSDGSTGPTLTVGQADTYSVIVDVGGCLASDAMVLTTRPLPVVVVADGTMCPGSTATLDATTTDATYLWSDGSTDPTLVVTTPGTYFVQVTVDGCSTMASADVDELALHSVDLGPDLTICNGDDATLVVNMPGAAFLWNTGESTASIVADTEGWYWVDVAYNGCAVRDSLYLTVTLVTTPGPWTIGAICPGTTTAVDVTTPGGTNYVWNDGTTGPIQDLAPGAYTVTMELDGCPVTGMVDVGELPAPVVSLGNDTTLCPGATLVLDPGNVWHAVTWGDGSISSTYTVTLPGPYSVSVEDASGCIATDAIDVGYADPGALDLGNDTTLCTGHFTQLDATVPGAVSYQWNNGSTGPTLVAGGIGPYWVDVTVGNCLLTDTIHVNTVAPPQVHLGNDTTLCPGASLVLDPGFTGLTHLWSDGSSGSQLTVSTAGTYSVTVTNGNGCAGSDAVTVDVLDALSIELGNDTLLCTGQDLLLDATIPGATYLWSTGATSPMLLVTEAGTYSVEVGLQGCSFQDAVDVGMVTLNAIDLGNDQPLCTDATLLLSIVTDPSATILWDDGSTATTRLVDEGGQYWARATVAHCSASDTILITDVAVPVVQLGNDTSICAGQTLVLDAEWPGASYLWNSNATTASIAATPGTWSVFVTAAGCSGHDAITIGEKPLPIADLPNDTVLCEGASIVLDVTQAGATYLWTDGLTQGSRTVTTSGTYAVTVELDGCTAGDGVWIDVVQPIVVDLGPDTVLCPGEQLVLTVFPQGAVVDWSTGATSPQISVSTAGTYAVVIDRQGCLSTDAITVGVTPVPVPDLGMDRVLCEGETTLLVVDAPGATLTWQDGSTAGSFLVDGPGLYSATVELDGCTMSDAVTITYDPIVRTTGLAGQQVLCFGEEIVLSAAIPGAQYQWSNGATTPSITVRAPGTFTVAATGSCIDARDTVVVTEGACTPQFLVPNAFTPDGDGHNDTFVPFARTTPREYQLRIFDRWGMEVFASQAVGLGWDGTFNGQDVPDGVYVWTVRYKSLGDDGVRNGELRGHVTLLR